jgi:methyl-accepting chemotaxis protein
MTTEQINRALQEVEIATQRGAIISDQTVTIAEELANQAVELQDMIGYFTISETRRPQEQGSDEPGSEAKD